VKVLIPQFQKSALIIEPPELTVIVSLDNVMRPAVVIAGCELSYLYIRLVAGSVEGVIEMEASVQSEYTE
jgi:hypothetical protein